MSTAQAIPNSTNTNNVFNLGRRFTDALKDEGLSDSAQQVNQMLKNIALAEPKRYLTVPEFVETYLLSEEWVDKLARDGKITTIQIDETILILKSSLADFDEINALYEGLPIPTAEEVNVITDEWRKDWTWVGKEK